MTGTAVAHLILDVETVADADLIHAVKGLSPIEFLEDLRRDRPGSILPVWAVKPVCVSVAKVGSDLSLLGIASITGGDAVAKFWLSYLAFYGRPQLVTFNGRSYDLPVLELGAFRAGVAVPAWFNNSGPGYAQSRNRYNSDAHFDIREFLSNFGAGQIGGLDACAKSIGVVGKSNGINGSMVQGLWDEGKLQEICDYCESDVLSTYCVFLRCQLLLGKLNPEREEQLRKQACSPTS